MNLQGQIDQDQDHIHQGQDLMEINHGDHTRKCINFTRKTIIILLQGWEFQPCQYNIKERIKNMIIDVGYWTRILKKILMLAISLVLIFLTLKLAIFYMPFLIGFIISLLVEPLIKKIAKKTNIDRKKCAIGVLIIIFIILLGLLAWGIVSLITESSSLLQGFNQYVEIIYKQARDFISSIKDGTGKIPQEIITIAENSTDKVVSFVSDFIATLLSKITQIISQIPIIGIYVFITLLATYFICTDKMYILDTIEHQLPHKWARKLGAHSNNIIKSLGDYLKAEVILIIISFLIVLIGLYILKLVGLNIEYPLLAAIGIGFVDALPILGSGTVMVPWAIISAINGDLTLGISIIILYAIVLVARQLIEPKIVSNKIGIHPIYTLIAMYTGFKITGILGLFVGPIVLIILKNIFSVSIENGIIKSLFI